jgi:hypothetical protein
MLMDNVGDLPEADPERGERIEAMLLDLHERVSVIELTFNLPMSFLDRTIAEKAIERRAEAEETRRRRLEAFEKAKAEVERAGHRGPIDDFVRRLKAGEFEPPLSPLE